MLLCKYRKAKFNKKKEVTKNYGKCEHDTGRQGGSDKGNLL